MTTISVQTGGKLYLAGEYAILTPQQTAIIKSIPIYMTARIAQSDRIELFSDLFDYPVGMADDSKYRLIQESVRTFVAFCHLSPEELTPFKLSISGNMGKNGKKYGIGSSGSVTVLTLKALAAFYGITISKNLLFKLAAYTLLKLGDNGSMGDIACIAYDDLIAYTSFDRERIAADIAKHSLDTLLEMDWGYRIEPLVPKVKADFLVGWTAQPALSSQMIKDLKGRVTSAFLEETRAAVEQARKSLTTGDKVGLIKALERVSDLLVDLSPAIYTDKLLDLKVASQGLDAVAKSSGAGGGDCGIALSFKADDTVVLKERWQQAGLELIYQESWSDAN